MAFSKTSTSNFLWDLFCTASVVGIWPRFIEPNLIAATPLVVKIPHLPTDLKGLKIAQFSDLHFSSDISDKFLEKLHRKIHQWKPDLIVFTGDFLCYSMLHETRRLHNWLKHFTAPLGCFAILGNHDYSQCVSINHKGDYDVIDPSTPPLQKAFKRLFTNVHLTRHVTDSAKEVPTHSELLALLKETPFQLLHNECRQIPVKDSFLNICGLGEYMLGRSLPEQAFASYDRNYPGLILAHNPDGIHLLKEFPGNIVLCGHTHGGQVNLPWMWKKFTLLENMQYKKGLFYIDNKWVYINRGIGSVLPFRWFAMPEILFLTLEAA